MSFRSASRKIVYIIRRKYHNNLTVNDIRKKHRISQKVWAEINKKFGEMFIKRHGKKKIERVKVSKEELNRLWGDQRQDQSPQSQLYAYR